MSAGTAVLRGAAGLARTPAGRFSWLKLAALLLAVAPGAWLALQWATEGLGPRGTNTAIHQTGTLALRFVLISLAVTPARALLDVPRFVMLRRLLGVTAAVYAGIHFSLYVIDQHGDLLHIASEIALRFYLTIGFVALLGLAALAWTSTNAWQKRLGRDWKRLHRLIFPLAVLAIFHHFLQAKADVSDAVFAAGAFAWLGFWRLEPRVWRNLRWPLVGLAIGAGLIAVAMEATWYGLATGVSGWRVLAANLDLSHGPRPGEWVSIWGFGVLALAMARPLWAARARVSGAAGTPAQP